MPVVRLRPVVRREPALEPAQRLLAGRESGLPLDERLERLDVLVVGHLEVDGAVVVADVEVQHPERKGKNRGFQLLLSCVANKLVQRPLHAVCFIRDTL